MTHARLSILLLGAMAACGGAPGAHHTGTPGGTIPVSWQATQAADEKVDVSLTVAGQVTALGQLSAAADDAPGTPATCSVMSGGTPTAIGFTCGGTPAYNRYRAALVGGELVVTLETGIDAGDGPPTDAKTVEVKRIPVTGSSLSVAPYAPGH